MNQAELTGPYYRQHRYCPACGELPSESTCMGYICLDPATFQDMNRTWCACGWQGTTHELVSEPV